MTDYKELIEQLRDDIQIVRNGLCFGYIPATEKDQEAATAIETLLSQLTVAQSERDVATKRIIELEQELAHSDEGLGIYESRIAQLENEKEDMWKELDRVKAERDAAVKCLEDARACETCEHMDTHPDCDVECLGCQKDCQCRDCRDGSNFKWKGAKEDT